MSLEWAWALLNTSPTDDRRADVEEFDKSGEEKMTETLECIGLELMATYTVGVFEQSPRVLEIAGVDAVLEELGYTAKSIAEVRDSTFPRRRGFAGETRRVPRYTMRTEDLMVFRRRDVETMCSAPVNVEVVTGRGPPTQEYLGPSEVPLCTEATQLLQELSEQLRVGGISIDGENADGTKTPHDFMSKMASAPVVQSSGWSQVAVKLRTLVVQTLMRAALHAVLLAFVDNELLGELQPPAFWENVRTMVLEVNDVAKLLDPLVFNVADVPVTMDEVRFYLRLLVIMGEDQRAYLFQTAHASLFLEDNMRGVADIVVRRVGLQHVGADELTLAMKHVTGVDHNEASVTETLFTAFAHTTDDGAYGDNPALWFLAQSTHGVLGDLTAATAVRWRELVNEVNNPSERLPSFGGWFSDNVEPLVLVALETLLHERIDDFVRFNNIVHLAHGGVVSRVHREDNLHQQFFEKMRQYAGVLNVRQRAFASDARFSYMRAKYAYFHERDGVAFKLDSVLSDDVKNTRTSEPVSLAAMNEKVLFPQLVYAHRMAVLDLRQKQDRMARIPEVSWHWELTDVVRVVAHVAVPQNAQFVQMLWSANSVRVTQERAVSHADVSVKYPTGQTFVAAFSATPQAGARAIDLRPRSEYIRVLVHAHFFTDAALQVPVSLSSNKTLSIRPVGAAGNARFYVSAD